MRRATLSLCFVLGACSSPSSNVTLSIRQPGNRTLLGTVAQLVLRADRDGRTIAQATFAANASSVSISRVPYGTNTTFTLDGLSATGDSLAHGSTCPLDFEASAQSASLYLAPTHHFAATVGAPASERTQQMAITLASGDVLLAGGLDGATAVARSQLYHHDNGTFDDAPQSSLSIARAGAEVSVLSVGTLLTGGIGEHGESLDSAELYYAANGTFAPVVSQSLGARSEHRASVLNGDRVLLTGGYGAEHVAVDTTAIVTVQSDGSAQAIAGPPLTVARAAHASIVAIGTPVVIGGYDATGQPLASIEALSIADDGDIGAFQLVAQLQFARAAATATLLADGSVLVVGGIGSNGAPRVDAEVYNPITQSTRVYTLATPRSRHTATLLPDGRVLVIGGVGADGAPVANNELFIADVGFVSEQPLLAARAGHLALPLCDGSVLVTGGATDAELYMPAPD
ncbi:MAG: kelch repeat-containing protein [Polyangia bacterium]